MNGLIQAIIAIIVSFILSISSLGPVIGPFENEAKSSESVSAQQVDNSSSAISILSDEPKDCDVAPTIVIHGIGQSRTFLEDENGNYVYDSLGNQVTGWPLYFNYIKLVSALLIPLINSVIFQKDANLTQSAYKAVKEAVQLNAFNDDCTPMNNIVTVKYEKSLAKCTQEEKDFIYGCVPLQEYTATVGEENLYYFSYNSFGDIYSIADELNAFIQNVKKETGSDKVNIVPISLGGAVSTAYLDKYQSSNDIHKIVYIVPALNGSEIVGGVMSGKLDTSDLSLYLNTFPTLSGTDEASGYIVNIALRLLPNDVVVSLLNCVADGLSEGLLSRSTNMWGLVPYEMYDALAEKYLPNNTPLRQEADQYHAAQGRLQSTLKSLEEKGVQIYDICGYGCSLYCLIDSDSNSDKIIQSASTSLNATFADIGKTLPQDYEQKNYSNYNLISPDRVVDASTCEFPFRTWFFEGQDHERIGGNDVVISLATELLLKDNMNIYSDKNYPQFNGHRNAKDINNKLNLAKSVDTSALSQEDAAELNAAVDDMKKILSTTIIDSQETNEAYQRLVNILVKIGALSVKSEKEVADVNILSEISTVLYNTFGGKGYSEFTVKDVINQLNNVIDGLFAA